MYKLIWDMDPGIDDALALILALCSPEIQVLAITTVAGNAPVEMTTTNACRILEYMGVASIPVAMGATNPLNHCLEDARAYHGEDGMGNCGLPVPKLPVQSVKAWDLLANMALNSRGEVVLLATGPLTNIARALELYPQLPGCLARLIIMGGAYGLTPYGGGNRTPFAEFNIWQDPEAADVVLNCGATIFLVGLDVTMNPCACLNREHLEILKHGHTGAARLTARLAEYEINSHGCCRMHDAIALATLLDASLVRFIPAKVEVIKGSGERRGATLIMPYERGGSTQVACDISASRFIKLFLERIIA